MTVTTRKLENDMTPLHRVAIKANGIVIWEIESESCHTYHVTMTRQHVSSCERADGQPCPGWKYRHSCHHATLAQVRELEYQDRKREEEARDMAELAQEIVNEAAQVERRYRAPLNSANRELRMENGIPMR